MSVCPPQAVLLVWVTLPWQKFLLLSLLHLFNFSPHLYFALWWPNIYGIACSNEKKMDRSDQTKQQSAWGSLPVIQQMVLHIECEKWSSHLKKKKKRQERCNPIVLLFELCFICQLYMLLPVIGYHSYKAMFPFLSNIGCSWGYTCTNMKTLSRCCFFGQLYIRKPGYIL